MYGTKFCIKTFRLGVLKAVVIQYTDMYLMYYFLLLFMILALQFRIWESVFIHLTACDRLAQYQFT